jgi:hypothetical protein
MNRHLCHQQKMKQGHCLKRAEDTVVNQSCLVGSRKNIHKSKKKADCNTDESGLQHKSMGAYCLSFLLDKILFRIANAIDRGTAVRFLAIRNGDAN